MRDFLLRVRLIKSQALEMEVEVSSGSNAKISRMMRRVCLLPFAGGR